MIKSSEIGDFSFFKHRSKTNQTLKEQKERKQVKSNKARSK